MPKKPPKRWMWKELRSEVEKQQSPSTPYRRPEYMLNKHNQRVRFHAPHPTTPALDRFMAKTLQHFNGTEHCLVFYGGATFRVDDNTVTTPARFYWEATKGEKLAEGETLRRDCKTPRCVKHRVKR